MITSAQAATLKTAITGNTALTTFVTNRDCKAIADYYAVVTTTMIQVPVLSKGNFLMGVMPGISTLTSSTALQNKWDRFLRIVSSVEVVHVAQPAIQSLLGQIVTDGLMTQAQVDAFSKRPATRGENLLGGDVVITITDVAQTMFNPDGSLKV